MVLGMILSPCRECLVTSNPKPIYSPAPPPSDDWPCEADEPTGPCLHGDFSIEIDVPSSFRPSLHLGSGTLETISEAQQGVFIKICRPHATRTKHIGATRLSAFLLKRPSARAKLTIEPAARPITAAKTSMTRGFFLIPSHQYCARKLTPPIFRSLIEDRAGRIEHAR